MKIASQNKIKPPYMTISNKGPISGIENYLDLPFMGEWIAALGDDTALPDQGTAAAAGDDQIRILTLPV